MKTKKTILTLAMVGLIGTSSYVMADNYVFREQLSGVQSSVNDLNNGTSENGDETTNDGITTPSNFVFNENNDQLSGNVGGTGLVTIYDEVGTEIGQVNSDSNGDFTTIFGTGLSSGETIEVVVTDSTDTLSATTTVPELPTDVACYDPENIGKVGTYQGCMDMLIVDNTMLEDGTDTGYSIEFEGVSYTFGDSEHNIFTGQVTDMYRLFISSDFNQDIGYWDTSNVTDMGMMFFQNTSFNQSIGSWDTSNVTMMNNMFESTPFNQDISGWDTSSVTDMRRLFYYASNFNQNIGGWNTSNVIDMTRTFGGAETFNGDIGGWDTSNVTDMNSMFISATSFNQNISGWNTSNVTNMSKMFSDSFFSQYIGDWDTSSLTSASYMFDNAANFDQDISKWDLSKVEQLAYMFRDATSFNQDISGWDLSTTFNVNGMFYNAEAFNQDLSGWCVVNITDRSDFNYQANNWTEPKPVWGTCPRGEDQL